MTSIPTKRTLTALGAAAVLGVAAFGVAGAQTPPAGTPTRPAGQVQADQRYQQFLDTLAAKLGVTADKLKQALADTRQSLGLPADGPGFGFGGPGGHRGPRGFGVPLDAAAQAIGITGAQLRQELPGKSLADVAKAHNVDPAKVASALKADAAARIDQAVTAGRLTADQGTQAKQQANTRIDQQMTEQAPAGGFGPRGGPGAPGAPGAPGTPGAQRSSGFAPAGAPGGSTF